jgi:hypothetical protein
MNRRMHSSVDFDSLLSLLTLSRNMHLHQLCATQYWVLMDMPTAYVGGNFEKILLERVSILF